MKKNMVMPDYTCPLPTHFYIDPCNICNLRCPFCLTGTGKGTAKVGIMTLETFTTVFNRIADGANFIGLYNYGEPFMNPDILKMAAMVADRGIISRIDSNLTLKEMTDAEAEEVVKSGLTVLSASIDGAAQASYEKYRVRGSFNTAICNLERLQAAKKRLNANILLSWSFLINKFNEGEVQAALQRSREMGVDINFSLMSVDPGWRSSYHFDSTKLQALREKAASSHEPKGRRLLQILKGFLAKFHKPKVQKELPMTIDDLALPPSFPFWCKQPFNHMTISWNGDVYPCCVVHDSTKVMGNLLESSLELVWNNTNFKNSRAFLYENRCGLHSPCEACVIVR